MIVASVVRDFGMYRKCVGENPLLASAKKIPIDNREKNESVAVGYNRAIAALDLDALDDWVVFCHEDFEAREDVGSHLQGLDTGSLWGPIGVRSDLRFGIYHQWRALGEIEETNRDGGDLRHIGEQVRCGEPVEVFDCQCVIAHTSMLRNPMLRFDERLTFDLYVEDFCITAKEKCGMSSRVLPFKCRHWSHGKVQPRYYEQLAYLNEKWADVCYTGVSSYSIGCGAGMLRRLEEKCKGLLK